MICVTDEPHRYPRYSIKYKKVRSIRSLFLSKIDQYQIEEKYVVAVGIPTGADWQIKTRIVERIDSKKGAELALTKWENNTPEETK